MDHRDYMREFIGSSIFVQSHSNPLYMGMEGLIVYETARTFHIKCKGKLKIIPKATGKFMIKSDRFSLPVKGNSILMRPEERLKHIRKILKNENKGDYNN